MSVFESLLLSKTHTIREEEAGSSAGGMKNWTDLIAAVLESKITDSVILSERVSR